MDLPFMRGARQKSIDNAKEVFRRVKYGNPLQTGGNRRNVAMGQDRQIEIELKFVITFFGWLLLFNYLF